jgi:DNA mismatch repair protein MutL
MVVLASNPCRVHVLPELLVRKIAAGEVVERPASVVKELVENSLDAGATRIGITIEEGGARLIRVVDDGSGMTPEELRLSVVAHSTSKITTEEDLFAIATLGFRGEALASISAVSRLRMVSRKSDSDEGHEVRLTGDVLETARASGCPPGTTVEVSDLFFNVPARRKFLRAVSTEVGHINEQFTRFALAYPSVGLELVNNRRATFALPTAATRIERIGKFFGPELASALLKIEREEAGLRLEAHAAMPAQSRATPQWQYVFVNGRYIRDRYVQHAVREAYRGLMEPNRHPVIFLFLSIDPAQIDVNVHPTKIEVRWADANLVHSQVLSALREAFQRANLSPMLRTNSGREQLNTDEQDRLRRAFAESLLATPPLEPGASPAYGGLAHLGRSLPMGPENSLAGGQSPNQAELPGYTGLDPLETWRRLYGPSDRQAQEKSAAESGRVGGSAEELPSPVGGVSYSGTAAAVSSRAGGFAYPLGRPRAIQMHNLYLVAETEDGIVIVDQHALHERVIYEQLRRRLAEGDLEPQRLLLPETVKVTA